MKLEFAKYTDITEFAKATNPDMFSNYTKVYICPDTLNWWLSCVSENLNSQYEQEDGCFLIERDRLDYPNYDRIQDKYLCDAVVATLLSDWDGSAWDSQEAESLADAQEMISGGFGIISEEMVNERP